MPFGDPLSLFTLMAMLVGAGLYLRMVGKEKDRRERHILMRYYDLEQDEERKAKEAEAREKSNTQSRQRNDQEFVASRPSARSS